MIPYGKQTIDENDIRSVIDVLESDFITQGPTNKEFEDCIKGFTSSKHAITFNSATSALHSACVALGLKKGDFLWTSPNSFVASANCGVYCGANIDFVDIDSLTLNISIEELKIKLEKADRENKLPKVLIPVHFAGQSCDMQKIKILAQKYGFKVIEDASHAIGGKYYDELIGGCRYSDITIFSFHPVKIITTGEGGVATTNSNKFAQSMRLMNSHGITRNTEDFEANDLNVGDWYYEQISIGYNYRMTDIQAALGISQMNKLEKYVLKRNSLALRYDKALKGLPLILPNISKFAYSSRHLYPVQINAEQTNHSRKEVFKKLRLEGIGVNVHYIPIHLQPYFKRMGFKRGDFPNAEKYYSQAISIPLFQSLTNPEQDYIIKTLSKIFSNE